MHTGPVDGVPGREVVGAVEHDVGRGDQRISAVPDSRCCSGTMSISGLIACRACLPDSALPMPTRAWV